MSKRNKRSDVFHHGEVGVAHCIQRCVRRAFLAGKDAVTGRSFEYRRDWIRKRLELLASVFGIDILNYAIMSNHLHVLLRTRPDVVKTWKDEDRQTMAAAFSRKAARRVPWGANQARHCWRHRERQEDR